MGKTMSKDMSCLVEIAWESRVRACSGLFGSHPELLRSEGTQVPELRIFGNVEVGEKMILVAERMRPVHVLELHNDML